MNDYTHDIIGMNFYAKKKDKILISFLFILSLFLEVLRMFFWSWLLKTFLKNLLIHKLFRGVFHCLTRNIYLCFLLVARNQNLTWKHYSQHWLGGRIGPLNTSLINHREIIDIFCQLIFCEVIYDWFWTVLCEEVFLFLYVSSACCCLNW